MSIDKHLNADGTYNGVAVISELTSLPQGEILTLVEQIKANYVKLEACAWHEFEPAPESSPAAWGRYVCRHCQGTIDSVAYRWHELGRRTKT